MAPQMRYGRSDSRAHRGDALLIASGTCSVCWDQQNRDRNIQHLCHLGGVGAQRGMGRQPARRVDQIVARSDEQGCHPSRDVHAGVENPSSSSVHAVPSFPTFCRRPLFPLLETRPDLRGGAAGGALREVDRDAPGFPDVGGPTLPTGALAPATGALPGARAVPSFAVLHCRGVPLEGFSECSDERVERRGGWGWIFHALIITLSYRARTRRGRLGALGHGRSGRPASALGAGTRVQRVKAQSWGVGLALLVCRQRAAATPALATGVAPTTGGVDHESEVGVHTRLTDEVEAWKIQASLAMVREMGAPWIVEYFPWACIEPERGKFTWDHSDTVISDAENQV